eukprot:Phypoly_transcript_13637.p1 GENE.Phypoly_transcript_13637~~Phypoly_transcript_13637.p1  ORF type:complete len:303 (+),score=28.84 Phypoly_transcript_13637:68-976(+)
MKASNKYGYKSQRKEKSSKELEYVAKSWENYTFSQTLNSTSLHSTLWQNSFSPSFYPIFVFRATLEVRNGGKFSTTLGSRIYSVENETLFFFEHFIADDSPNASYIITPSYSTSPCQLMGTSQVKVDNFVFNSSMTNHTSLQVTPTIQYVPTQLFASCSVVNHVEFGPFYLTIDFTKEKYKNDVDIRIESLGNILPFTSYCIAHNSCLFMDCLQNGTIPETTKYDINIRMSPGLYFVIFKVRAGGGNFAVGATKQTFGSELEHNYFIYIIGATAIIIFVVVIGYFVKRAWQRRKYAQITNVF